jgi:hypothetical protein
LHKLFSPRGIVLARLSSRGTGEFNLLGEPAILYRTEAENRGGGEGGFTNREISNALANCTGRSTSREANEKLAGGNTNAPAINAGRAVSWQQDIEHGDIPLISCPQSIGAESSGEAGGCW